MAGPVPLCGSRWLVQRGRSLEVSPLDHMSIRRFFLLSLALAILAVGLHLTAMSQTIRGLRISAQAVTAPESYRATAREVARSYARRGTVLGCIGLASALASVMFAVVSARRHEPARRVVLFGVLTCYVMLQFVLV